MFSKQTLQRGQNRGLTDLMSAVLNQDLDLTKALLESGTELETRDKQGQNVLYHAFPEIFSHTTLETLQLLIAAGINVNSSLDGDGCSALVTAVVMDWPQVVTLLIDNGVDINEDAMTKSIGSLSSDSTQHHHNNNNSMRIADLSTDDIIISVDVSINATVNDPAAATTQFIFSKGCGHTVTPLLCAVMQQKRHLVDMILSAKASSNSLSFGTFWRATGSSVCSSCDIKITPLHMAAYIGDLHGTYKLIQHEESNSSFNNSTSLNDNDSRYFTYMTPLWLALLQGHVRIVKLFLSLGKLNSNSLTCHFGSGLEVCLQEGHTALALMLLRAGYDLNDDLEWIEDKNYPCSNAEVIDHIEALADQPRSLLDWCSSSLRDKFGLALDDYLAIVGAPKKICDIINFNDLSKASWQDVLPQNKSVKHHPPINTFIS